MTMIWHVPTVVITLLAWVSSASSSFVDISRKEAVRRQLTAQSVGVYSNDTLPRVRPSDTADASGAAFTVLLTPVAADASPIPAAPGSSEVAPEAPKQGTEEWWRERMKTLRSAVARDELLVETLQSQVAGLQRDVTSRDDPAQRAALTGRLAEARAELERTRAKLQAQRAQIEKMKDDGRRQGVPAGWTR